MLVMLFGMNISAAAVKELPAFHEIEKVPHMVSESLPSETDTLESKPASVFKTEGQNPAAGIAALLVVLATAGACRLSGKKRN